MEIDSENQERSSLTIAEKVIAGLFAAITVVLFVGVVFRYVLNSSLSWTGEVARYLFVWLVFLGSAVAMKDRIHIRVEYFAERLPDALQRHIAKVNRWLLVSFVVALMVLGFRWVVEVHGTLSPALGLPLNIVFYGALPVSMMVALYYLIQELREGTPEKSENLQTTTTSIDTEESEESKTATTM